MKALKPPIFVWDPNDLLAFDSVEAAERYLEAVDVDDGVYKAAYDVEGRLLQLRTAENPSRFFGGNVVRIEAAEEQPTHIAALEEILRHYLGAVGRHSNEWLQNATTQQLINTAAKLAATK